MRPKFKPARQKIGDEGTATLETGHKIKQWRCKNLKPVLYFHNEKSIDL
jgi:hypothetical protein